MKVDVSELISIGWREPGTRAGQGSVVSKAQPAPIGTRCISEEQIRRGIPGRVEGRRSPLTGACGVSSKVSLFLVNRVAAPLNVHHRRIRLANGLPYGTRLADGPRHSDYPGEP